jgi:DNA-binding NarL/FixJ family response regulator
VKRIRVLIADDHALVRTGLRALLESQPDMEVVGEAEDGAVALTRCEKLRPDVVLMDLSMPGRGGISATEDLGRSGFKGRVLVLTMHDDEAYVRMARLAGAAGFVLKRSLATELIAAVRAVSAGGMRFPPAVTPAPAPASGKMPLQMLSAREREVLEQLALGHTNGEIALKLHISEKTVETHRAHILEKLDLKTRADLVRFALEHGVLKRP